MEYRLQGKTLFITGDLSGVVDDQFEAYTEKLLKRRGKMVVIDLSTVNYMVSSYLGSLANLAVRARRHDKQVKLIVSKPVAQIIRQVGLDQLVELEEVKQA